VPRLSSQVDRFDLHGRKVLPMAMFATLPLAPFLLKNNYLFHFSMLNNASRHGSARHKRDANLNRALSRGEQHIRERNITPDFSR